MWYKFSVYFFFSCLVFSQVLSQELTVSYGNYRISKDTKKDSSVLRLIASYKDSIDKTMNTIIGFSVDGLSKKQPESGLGNFMTDAMRILAEKEFNIAVDAAFINYGGVRSYIPKGNITVGNIFELMPFDNTLVLQKVRGDTLQSFLNHIAARNGWPISGITMGIKEKKAVNVLVKGNPIVNDSLYTIANSNYIAIDGGDDTKMLKGIPVINKGILLRSILIEYTKMLTDQGKSIDTRNEKRIIYSNE